MDQLGHALFPTSIKLLGVKAECTMTDGTENPTRCRGTRRCYALPLARRSKHPRPEQLVKMPHIGFVLSRLLNLEAKCTTLVLSFQTCVSEQHSHKGFALLLSELQHALVGF